MHLIDGGTHPQGESGDTGHRHHHDNQCIQEALVKNRVLKELDIVLQSCEPLDTAQAILRKAVEQADEHGHDHEGHEKDQAGQQEQIGGDGLSPHQGAAHAGELGLLLLFGLPSGLGRHGILRHECLPSFKWYLPFLSPVW